MKITQEACLLRIFVGESDKYENMPLYEWIVRRARQEKITGATAIRAILGYGGHSQIHTAKILQLSLDLPIIVEIVDTEEKIDAFMSIVDEVITGGMATVEKVRVKYFHPK